MKRFVDLDIPDESIAGHRHEFFGLPAVQFQRREFIRALEPLSRHSRRGPFEHAAHVDCVPDVIERERAHPETGCGDRLEQSLVRKPIER